jgi:hypothetical protein
VNGYFIRVFSAFVTNEDLHDLTPGTATPQVNAQSVRSDDLQARPERGCHSNSG